MQKVTMASLQRDLIAREDQINGLRSMFNDLKKVVWPNDYHNHTSDQLIAEMSNLKQFQTQVEGAEIAADHVLKQENKKLWDLVKLLTVPKEKLETEKPVSPNDFSNWPPYDHSKR